MTVTYNLTNKEISKEQEEIMTLVINAFLTMADECPAPPHMVSDAMLSALVNYLVDRGACLPDIASGLAKTVLALDPPAGNA